MARSVDDLVKAFRKPAARVARAPPDARSSKRAGAICDKYTRGGLLTLLVHGLAPTHTTSIGASVLSVLDKRLYSLWVYSGTAVTWLASGMGRSEISHMRYAVSQQLAACGFSPILL